MIRFILRRFGYMSLIVAICAVLSFFVIQLPPGDFVSSMVSQMVATGGAEISPDMEARMRDMYGLDQPTYVQFFKWVRNIFVKGDFGYSFVYRQDAKQLIGERLPMSVALTFFTLALIWVISIPIGVYSAINKYKLSDYIVTLIGFVGLAIPGFLLALLVLYFSYKSFGQAMVGLFSPEFVNAPWSLARIWDLIKHLWIPALIIGISGTAGMIRTMRANFLDELNKPYVVTARAKGLSEWKLLMKYPLRQSLTPFVSTIGWAIRDVVSGDVIVSTVLNLPTSGPLLLGSLLKQDMYVASGIILMLSILTVFGTFLSDILLAWLDPKIRLS